MLCTQKWQCLQYTSPDQAAISAEEHQIEQKHSIIIKKHINIFLYKNIKFLAKNSLLNMPEGILSANPSINPKAYASEGI